MSNFLSALTFPLRDAVAPPRLDLHNAEGGFEPQIPFFEYLHPASLSV